MRHLRSAGWIAAAAAVVAVDSLLSLRGQSWGDYTVEARPAVDALAHGHLHRFLELAPAYAGSLVLRGPFVLLARAFGANEAWLFRASAIPCLAAIAAVGLWLALSCRRRGAGTLTQALAFAVCAANPLVIQAVRWGHPEDVLGAALCVGAVLAALEDRTWWSGLLLGLAVANKEWGMLAAGPVLIALPRRRIAAGSLAAAVAALLLAPFLIAQMTAGGQGVLSSTSSSSILQRWDAWWFFGARRHLAGVHGPLYVSDRTGPSWISTLMHPAIALIGVLLSALYAWLRHRWAEPRRASDALLLLALLALLRCVLDPWDFVYYPLPFLIALAVWESVALGRAPLYAMGASVAAWLLMQETAMPILGISQDVQSLLFMAVAVPGVVAIALRLYRRPRSRSWSRNVPHVVVSRPGLAARALR